VFDHKPYAHYDAVTNKAIVISLYDHTNDGGEKRYAGTFSVSFACYEPFAQLASSCYDTEPDECTLARTG